MAKPKFHISIPLILLFLFCIPSFGSSNKQAEAEELLPINKKLNFKSLNSITHSDVNTVFYVDQDSAGYIWLGTASAICRYDGSKVKSFHLRDSLSNQISDTFFSVLQLDSDQILLSTRLGAYIFDKRTLQISLIEGTQNYKVYRAVRSHNKNLVWITTNRHILLYNTESKHVEIFDPVKIIPESGVMTNLRMYGYKSPSGEFMIGTYNYVLAWNERLNKFDYFAAPRPDKSRPSHVGSIVECQSNRDLLYLGTEQGLFLYDCKSKVSKKLLQADRVDALTYDNQGRLWVGTSIGLFVIGRDNKIMGHYTHVANDQNSLCNNLIHNLKLDSRNNLWIGTERGVSMVSLNNNYQQFSIYEITADTKGANINRIIKDRNGNLIISGANGVIIYNELSGKHIWLSSQSKELRHRLLTDNVVNIRLDKHLDLLWLCTSQGLHCYDIAKDITRHFNIVVDNPIFHSGWCYDVNEDPQGLLYISTYESGLFVVDKASMLRSKPDTKIKAKRHYNAQDREYPLQEKHEVPWVCFSDSSSMWVYYMGAGIERISLDQPTSHFVFNAKKGNINSNYILKLSPILNYKLLALTPKGLGIIDPKTNQWQSLSIKGMSNRIRAISPVDQSRIWVQSKSVLQLIDLLQMRVVKSVNIPQNIYLSDIFYDHTSQRIYYSTHNAYGYFDISATKTDEREVRVSISDFLLMGETVEVGKSFQNNTILPLAVEYLQKINLLYNQNTFTLEFASADNSSSWPMLFKYRLLGLSDQWVTNNYGEDQAKFLNIPPGDYTFQVVLVDHAGNVTSNISSIDIRINRPWWSSVVAYIVYWLIAGAFVVFLWLRIQERSRAKIDQVKREKSIRYSQMKIAFLADIFKRIDEPLTNIISQAPSNEIIKESTDQLRQISAQFLGIVNTSNEQIDADQNLIASKPLWIDRSRNSDTILSIPQSPDIKLLRLIDQIIERDIQDVSLNVVTLSSQSGLSSKRIYHLLKSSVSMTPTDYIRHLRLERASILLRQGGFSVSEVLYLVGFSSHSYFTKCFKAKYGTTPREWANSKAEVIKEQD